MGKFVKLRREYLRMERPEFAQKLNRSYGAIANLEGGFNKPSAEMLISLAGPLKMKPGLLLDVYAEARTIEEALSVAEQEDKIQAGPGLTPNEQAKLDLDKAQHFAEGLSDLEELEMLLQIQDLANQLVERRNSGRQNSTQKIG